MFIAGLFVCLFWAFDSDIRAFPISENLGFYIKYFGVLIISKTNPTPH
jgi:hypothetical protein